jgi:hypothetical protein
MASERADTVERQLDSSRAQVCFWATGCRAGALVAGFCRCWPRSRCSVSPHCALGGCVDGPSPSRPRPSPCVRQVLSLLDTLRQRDAEVGALRAELEVAQRAQSVLSHAGRDWEEREAGQGRLAQQHQQQQQRLVALLEAEQAASRALRCGACARRHSGCPSACGPSCVFGWASTCSLARMCVRVFVVFPGRACQGTGRAAGAAAHGVEPRWARVTACPRGWLHCTRLLQRGVQACLYPPPSPPSNVHPAPCPAPDPVPCPMPWPLVTARARMRVWCRAEWAARLDEAEAVWHKHAADAQAAVVQAQSTAEAWRVHAAALSAQLQDGDALQVRRSAYSLPSHTHAHARTRTQADPPY